MWNIYYYLAAIIIVTVNSNLIPLKKWAIGQAHASLVVSVRFYNDNSKFVTAGDSFVKIWNIQTKALLHTFNAGDHLDPTDFPTHVNLHPVDNRIFILTIFGGIFVLDPNDFTILHQVMFPSAAASAVFCGNSLSWFDNNTKFFIAGQEQGQVPKVYVMNAATLANIAADEGATNFSLNSIPYVISVSPDKTKLALITKDPTIENQLDIYDVATKTVTASYTGFIKNLTTVYFNPYIDELYLPSEDGTVRVYRKNNVTNKYDIFYSLSVPSNGNPFDISGKIRNKIVIAAGKSLIFYTRTAGFPTEDFRVEDQENIFTFDISPNQKYYVTGMKFGQVTLWQKPQTVQQQPDKDYKLLIILTTILGGSLLIIIAAIIFYRCCCMKSSITNAQNVSDNIAKPQTTKAKQPKTDNSFVSQEHDFSMPI